MVKLRMTTVDVAAQVLCLRRLIGMRCANIYDLSPKTYVIKFAKSSGVAESGESEKALLLLESGVRLHTTQFTRDKSTTPSGFTLKLRKHLRTRRLEDVRQLGIDRIVDFQFGLGETSLHLLLELYAQGNFVLTDSAYNILQLLRTWKDEEKGVSMAIHQRYPIDSCRLLEKTSLEKLEGLFKVQNLPQSDGVLEKLVTDNGDQNEKKPKTKKWGKEGLGEGSKGANFETARVGKNGARGGATLKFVLGEGLGYGPILIEHIILDASLQPDLKIAGEGKSPSISEAELKALAAAVERFELWLAGVATGEVIPEGFIFMQKPSPGRKPSFPADMTPESDKMQVYDEFYPLVLKQLEHRQRLKFETFDAAMDEFFSKVEGQRAQQQRKAQEDSAFNKLEKIRADQTNRVKTLKKEVDQSVRMAELIEYNLEDVDAGILAVRTALASGMDWKDLGRVIKEEKKAGNPVAGLIHSLQLESNQITLLLSNNLDDMDEQEKTQPVQKVEVDLSLSAHANARRWFETKKRHATKQEKTLAAHEKAFKAAEKRTQQQLAQAKTVAAITHIRKVHWFEKFRWFISSENFLVISGRDAHQNELLVKRYMKKGDLYVHADIHGASSTIIKNPDPTHPVPPLTINQAGCFTMCCSQAWDLKIVTSAWWVEPHQVSKTAPTGEYLTLGSFMIRGKKNFLPPSPLVMGYGFLFRLDDSSIATHLNERRVRGEDEEGGAEEEEPYMDDVQDLEREASPESQLQVEDGESDPVSHNVEIDNEVNPGSDDESEEAEEPAAELRGRTAAAWDDSVSTETAESSELYDLIDKALELRSMPRIDRHHSKYGLEDLKVADIESDDAVSEQLNMSKVAQRDKPYMSKAERRKLKKGGKQLVDTLEKNNAGDETPVDESILKDAFEENLGAVVESAGAHVDNKGKKGPVRGQKGKLKKIKEKYSEQDEEEAQLRMTLLASARRKDGNEKDNRGGNRVKSKEEVSRVEVDLGLKVCYKCKKTGHIASDCPNDAADLIQGKDEMATSARDTGAGISGDEQALTSDDVVLIQGKEEPTTLKETQEFKEGGSWRSDTKAAEAKIAAIMGEGSPLELGDDEKEKLTELDTLTGKPVPSDVLLYAVPVCGPYSALQGYKYRVKLTPGTSKRGKAAKVAVNVFTHLQEVGSSEKDLMKAVTDPELVASMIGNSKVTAPGLSKLRQTQKKSRKTSAR